MKKQTKDSKQMLFEMMHKVGGMPLNETISPNPENKPRYLLNNDLYKFLSSLGYSDMYNANKNNPEKLSSYFNKILKGNNLQIFNKLVNPPLSASEKDYEYYKKSKENEGKIKELRKNMYNKLDALDTDSLVNEFIKRFHVKDDDASFIIKGFIEDLSAMDNGDEEDPFGSFDPDTNKRKIVDALVTKITQYDYYLNKIDNQENFDLSNTVLNQFI